jgi:hypothetical protein
MFLNSEALLARKMILESKWNQQFLEQGKETIDMLKIELELKELKKQLRVQTIHEEISRLKSEEEDINYIAS